MSIFLFDLAGLICDELDEQEAEVLEAERVADWLMNYEPEEDLTGDVFTDGPDLIY